MNAIRLRNVFAAAALLAAAATAQNASTIFTRNFGNGTFGGRVQLAANASHQLTSSRLSSIETSSLAASARGDVRLNRTLREAAFVRFGSFSQTRSSRFARIGSTTRSSRTALTVRIGGRTVLSRSATTTRRFASSITPRSVFAGGGVRANYSVGPFTVSLNAQATAGVRYDATATLTPSPVAVRLGGFIRTFANGRASTSVGVPGLRAGVRATLNLANTRADASLTASRTGVSGRVSWRTEAIRIAVDLFARIFPVSFSARIVNVALGVSSGSRVLR